ncbi:MULTISPECIES: DUF2589 domain-containing protein [unclassified Pseudomonas]|uniref:DUF2589 domain-containing protein n=1 Tax=unclassified Pseudomonas TaxID=196821 RepID=UPI001E58FCC2|nr:DUF2589 domain-containing protein [Pseudomonas sp. AA27]MCE0916996.1 DUF2589 domain-containing protein [Pseudomonas sp. NMI760_13]MCF1489565.1 DUF2589 domain-containing protein [Pseudomonas sp. AA27]MDC0689970.1 DUF2589 domain-containing protein [Mitsuaria sp. RG]
MANQSLHHLIQSIAGAVAEAQDKIQRFQVSTVRQYFDEDNRPVSIDVRLPSHSPEAKEGEERVVRVPLLSLVGARLMAVKDMEISFEVGLNADDGSAANVGPATAGDDDSGWPSETHKALNVDLGVRRNGEGGPLARVTLKVETQPPSEGMARLLQNLDKLI